MKKIFIIMAILTLFAPVGAYACLVAFDFGYGFGFGSNSGGSVPSGGPTGDGIQLETGDFLLTEDSKYLIQE
jgi:hypothetical protein